MRRGFGVCRFCFRVLSLEAHPAPGAAAAATDALKAALDATPAATALASWPALAPSVVAAFSALATSL
jgi:hypothetical protein